VQENPIGVIARSIHPQSMNPMPRALYINRGTAIDRKTD
jgi:hypothetical protein